MWEKFSKRFHHSVNKIICPLNKNLSPDSSMCNVCIHARNCDSKLAPMVVERSVLCDCGNCQIEDRGFFETLPLEDGHWTSCQVHVCKNCGRMGGFPKANLEDAILHGTPETKQALRDVGIPVDEVIARYSKVSKTQIADERLNPSRRDE